MLDAFNDLLTCLNQNGVIPWTAINEYAIRNHIRDFDAFKFLIHKMNACRIKIMDEKKPKEPKKDGQAIRTTGGGRIPSR